MRILQFPGLLIWYSTSFWFWTVWKFYYNWVERPQQNDEDSYANQYEPNQMVVDKIVFKYEPIKEYKWEQYSDFLDLSQSLG